jgi:hypothetical protein
MNKSPRAPLKRSLLLGIREAPGKALLTLILLFVAFATMSFGLFVVPEEEYVTGTLLIASLLSGVATLSAFRLQGCLRYLAVILGSTQTVVSLYGAYIFLPGW